MDRRPRAFALVVVLVATAVVFAIAVQAATFARAASAEAGALVQRARAEREARSAISVALAGLVAGRVPVTPNGSADGRGDAPGGPPAGSINEDEAPEMPAAMRELIGKLTGEDPPEPDGDGVGRSDLSRSRGSARGGPIYHDALVAVGMPVRPIVIKQGDARFAVTFRDARGVLQVNTAAEGEIARLLRAHDIDPPLNLRIAQELADYRDEDDFVRERGAERPDYARRGLTPRNAPLETIDELRFLPSMTPQIFQRIRDDLCVGGDGRIHVQSASPEVLRAVEGVTPAGVERLLTRRAEGPMTREGLADALSPASLAAIDRFRLTPSTRLVGVVRRLDAAGASTGPAVEVEIALVRRRGVAFLATRHTATEPAS